MSFVHACFELNDVVDLGKVEEFRLERAEKTFDRCVVKAAPMLCVTPQRAGIPSHGLILQSQP